MYNNIDIVHQERQRMTAALIVLFSYFLGSIPAAYIAGRVFKGIDIRKTGDKNVGAANAYREIGPAVGLGVLVFDVGKGAIAIMVAQTFASQFVVLLSGLAVVAGHNWPVYLHFRGGRGEATAAGVLFVLLPQAMLVLLAVCIIPFILTRNTMLAGAILFAPLWLVALLMGESGTLIGYSIVLPCMVGLTHVLTTRHLEGKDRSRSNYMR